MFPVPKELQRLVDAIDGWIDLRCPDKALEMLAPLLDHPEARPAGLALRVRALTQQKRHREALQDLGELRTTAFDPEWLDLTEAWCRKRVQDLPGAVRCMQQLLERNPKSAIGHFNLGCYLALRGERERALDEVTLACGLDATMREMLEDTDLDSLRRDARFQQLLARHHEDVAAADTEDELADYDEAYEAGDADEGDDEDADADDDEEDDDGEGEGDEPKGRR